LSGLTASTALALNASKQVVSVTNTGTGDNVLSNSPTLVTPALGTPASGVVTNLTGTASININGTVGATTASTGAFTTLTTTGNVTLGDASTDTVTVNGYMGVGGGPLNYVGLRVTGSVLGNADQYGISSSVASSSGATSSFSSAVFTPTTAAASFTVANVHGLLLQNATKGAGSTITNQHGVQVNDQTQGTNNYGITSLVSSGTNKWNIYASGTANNYLRGNLYIGQDTTANGLQITYSSPESKIYSAVGTGSRLVFATSTSGGVEAERLRLSSTEAVFNDPGNDYDFRVESDTNSHALFVQGSDGNVGIGTSSPNVALNVIRNSSPFPAIIGGNRIGGIGIKVFNSNTAHNAFIAFGEEAGDSSTPALIQRFGSTSASPNEFRITNAVSGPTTVYTNNAERLRIDSAGNVGIGTSAPIYDLQVGSYGVDADSTLALASTTTGTGTIRFGDGTSGVDANAGLIQYVHTNNAMTFSTVATERMRITDAGNVGIGTSSPNASAILDAQSTTKGVRMPNMTTTQKNAIASPAAGLMVYDTTLAKLCVYTTAWETITSS
jgi:hypothetical protein